MQFKHYFLIGYILLVLGLFYNVCQATAHFNATVEAADALLSPQAKPGAPPAAAAPAAAFTPTPSRRSASPPAKRMP